MIFGTDMGQFHQGCCGHKVHRCKFRWVGAPYPVSRHRDNSPCHFGCCLRGWLFVALLVFFDAGVEELFGALQFLAARGAEAFAGAVDEVGEHPHAG